MLQPLKDKILARHLAAETSKSAFLLTDAPKPPEMQQAIVVAHGPSVTAVRPGDTVWFRSHVGAWLERDKEEFTVIREIDLDGYWPQ